MSLCIPPTQQLSTAAKGLVSMYPFCDRRLTVRSCVGFVEAIIAAASLWVLWPCHVWKTAFHNTPLPLPALIFSLPSFPRCSLSLGRGDKDVSFRAGH